MSRDRGVRAEHSKYGARIARITTSACPFCGALQDGATSLQEPETPIQPDPGDYSICITCGKLVGARSVIAAWNRARSPYGAQPRVRGACSDPMTLAEFGEWLAWMTDAAVRGHHNATLSCAERERQQVRADTLRTVSAIFREVEQTTGGSSADQEGVVHE